MPWIDKKDIERAKEADALSWLIENRPHELIKLSEGYYCLKIHGSLKLDHGKWCWWSRGIGGRSAVDLLVKVYGMSFYDAVCMVLSTSGTPFERKAVMTNVICKEANPDKKAFLVPEADINNDAAIRYLLKRKIPEKIIGDFIREGVMYQEKEHKNIVFLGKDYDGNVRLAAMRGTYGSYHHTVSGSDRRYPFMRLAGCRYDRLHVFEAPVDMLSYAGLLYLAGRSYRDINLMALCGIYKARENIEESTLPVALSEYLERFPDTKEVFLHLDNDETGISAAEAIMTVIKSVKVINSPPPLPTKDVNEHLMNKGALWHENRTTKGDDIS